MKYDFEKYLEDVHAKNYTGTDDDMPDKFDAWLERLDGEEYMKYAEAYKMQMIKELIDEIPDYQRTYKVEVGRLEALLAEFDLTDLKQQLKAKWLGRN